MNFNELRVYVLEVLQGTGLSPGLILAGIGLALILGIAVEQSRVRAARRLQAAAAAYAAREISHDREKAGASLNAAGSPA